MYLYNYEIPKVLNAIRLGLTPYRTEEDELCYLGTRQQLHEFLYSEQGDEQPQAEADRLKLDLFTPEGNKAYAEHLYMNEGNTPWHWSKTCWNK